MVVRVFQIEKLSTKWQEQRIPFGFAGGLAENAHVPMQLNQEFKFLLGIPADLSLQTHHLFMWVSAVLVFSSQISFILEDLMGNLLNFPYASFLHDPANEEVIAPITNCICTITVA